MTTAPRTCGSCRCWSDRLAESRGAVLVAVCLNSTSPKAGAYLRAADSCPKWLSGHLGAIDEAGRDPRRYEDEAEPAAAEGVTAWYYLHENGELLCKPNREGIVADFRDSTLVRAFWPIEPCDRKSGWRVLVEGLAGGAKPERVRELAHKWGCNDADGQLYADKLGAILMRDGNQWCAAKLSNFVNIQESPCGFGPTVLEALAQLAKALGYEPSPWGGASIEQLLQPQEEPHG